MSLLYFERKGQGCGPFSGAWSFAPLTASNADWRRITRRDPSRPPFKETLSCGATVFFAIISGKHHVCCFGANNSCVCSTFSPFRAKEGSGLLFFECRGDTLHMSEFLKDLERRRPGDPMPPMNLGPYDNPLLWNMVDPYGADRSHQRRPISVSRNFMELHHIPLLYRDHCVHRFLPFAMCHKNLRPLTFGGTTCHEFEEAWQECRAFERYRSQLMKEKFMDLTAKYTEDDKHFFPNQNYISVPYSLNSHFWAMAASCRLAGMDDNDPQNPLMQREPNRALMRAEFGPTNWEKKMATSVLGYKILPPKMVADNLMYPLPEDKRPSSLLE